MMGRRMRFVLAALPCVLNLSSAWISNGAYRCNAFQSSNHCVQIDSRRLLPLSSLSLTRSEDVSSSSSSRSSTKKSHDEMIRFIESPIASTVGDHVADMDDDLVAQLEKIVKAADGRKANDLVVLAIGHVSTLAQALVICSGNSRPQNQAISNAVQDAMEGEMEEHILPEGNPNSGWMILDYGSIMVHIMTPKSRLFYNVEGQWREKGGKDFQPQLLEQWIQLDRPDADGGASRNAASAEEDPFWS